MSKIRGIFFLLLLTLFSCKKDEPGEINLGYDYQPLEVGHWVEYQVDSIFFDDFNERIDTFTFFRRELLESEFADLNGEPNFRVEQSVKSNIDDAWQIIHVASFKRTAINLQKVENDLRFVKFAFPPMVGKSWQGHIFINTGGQASLEYLDRERFDWTYRFTSVGEPMSMGGFNFSETAEIVQIDEENLFEKKFSKEIYAKNVGLISKEMLILETQAPPSGVSFIDRAQKGFIVKYTISNFKQ